MSFPGKMAAQVIGGGLFQKPATLLYPYEKATMPLGFRGRLVFYAERCVFCKLCMKDCPSEAIQINKLGREAVRGHRQPRALPLLRPVRPVLQQGRPRDDDELRARRERRARASP